MAMAFIEKLAVDYLEMKRVKLLLILKSKIIFETGFVLHNSSLSLFSELSDASKSAGNKEMSTFAPLLNAQ
jgi:hypothetical protein